jgi:hypothetical protein
MMSAFSVSPFASDPFATDDVSLGTAGYTLGGQEPAPAPVPPPRVSPSWLRDEGAMLDLYGHYAEPAPAGGLGAIGGGLNGFLDRLANRDGMQVDKGGVGFSHGNTRYRFMPIIPGLND